MNICMSDEMANVMDSLLFIKLIESYQIKWAKNLNSLTGGILTVIWCNLQKELPY